jgi:Protein of unknown function (DUF3716)
MRNYYLRPLLISSSSFLFQTNFKHSSTRRHIFNSTIIYHVSIVRRIRLSLIIRRALIPYDHARAQAALAAVVLHGGQPHPVLVVGQRQLASFVHNVLQRALLALPGQDVEFVFGRILPRQIGSHRPSYVNAILIQSRGRTGRHSCDSCVSADPGPYPFPSCRRVPGHFGGACANCKWRDHASRCTVRDENGGDGDPEDDSSDDSDVEFVGERRLEAPPPGRAAGAATGTGTANNPIAV